jgi:hypothetical protein
MLVVGVDVCVSPDLFVAPADIYPSKISSGSASLQNAASSVTGSETEDAHR